MDDPKALRLFQEVLAKTKSGKVEWESASTGVDLEQYSSALPSDRELVISLTHVKNSWGDEVGDEYALVLRHKGLELLRVSEAVEGLTWKDLSELFELARRHALRVDDTVDEVLGDLANL